MIYLKQSTAVNIKIGPFLDDTDGKTAETGLSLTQADVRLSKNGGANAQKNSATAPTHNELGYYTVALSATDTNTLGSLKVMVSKEGALPVWAEFSVLHAKVYDAMFSTGLVELVAAYDNAKIAPDNTGIANIKAKTDNLPASPAAVGSQMKLEDGAIKAVTLATGTITADKIASNAIVGAKISNDAIFKIQDGTAREGTLTDIKGAGWNETQTLSDLLEAIEDIDISGGGGNTAEQIRAAIGLALANLDTQLSGLLTAINSIETDVDLTGIAKTTDVESAKDDVIAAMPTIPNDYAKETNATANKEAIIAAIPAVPNDYAKPSDIPTVEEIQDGIAKTSELPVIPDDYAKEATLTAGIDDVLEAIDDKPVTPVTDLSEVAKTSELEAAKDEIIEAIDDKEVTPATDLTDVMRSLDNMPQRVWSWNVRTLTNPALIIPSPGTDAEAVIYKSTTGRLEFNNLADLDIADKIWFTVKEDNALADNQAILQIEKTAGLVYLYKTSPDDISNQDNNITGTLTVSENNISIVLSPEASLRLPVMSVQPVHWDLKMRTTEGEVKILVYGELLIQDTPTENIGAE